MKKNLIVLISFYILFTISFVDRADAAIFKYIDKNGVVCFADDLQSVPKQFRTSAIIVEGEAKGDEQTNETSREAPRVEDEGEKQALSVQEPEKFQSETVRSFGFRLMISALVGLGGIVVFMIVNKQTGLKENKKVLSVIRASLIGIVSLYLVIAHGRDIVTILDMAGKAVGEVQQQSAEKGRKAGRAIKTLDALFKEAAPEGE